MRTWIDRGLHPAASTDAPVCETNPYPNIHTMITRKTASGRVLGADQRITLDEALSAMTLTGAYVAHCEAFRGTLATGMLADIAVHSRDLFDAAPEQILHDTVCDLTLLDGEIVHDRLDEFVTTA
jgi:predicted amidohydrolase YtcJ